jgi:thiol:disulfide interchange protein
MHNFEQSVLAMMICGLISGLALGMSHYLTKPYKWNNVKRYTYGCFWVFLGVSAYLIWETGEIKYVLGAWVILGISGALVAASYWHDGYLAAQRQKETDSDTTSKNPQSNIT